MAKQIIRKKTIDIGVESMFACSHCVGIIIGKAVLIQDERDRTFLLHEICYEQIYKNVNHNKEG